MIDQRRHKDGQRPSCPGRWRCWLTMNVSLLICGLRVKPHTLLGVWRPHLATLWRKYGISMTKTQVLHTRAHPSHPWSRGSIMANGRVALMQRLVALLRGYPLLSTPIYWWLLNPSISTGSTIILIKSISSILYTFGQSVQEQWDEF